MSRDVDAIVQNVSAQLDSTDKQAESKAYQALADEIHNVSKTQGDQAATELGTQVLHRLEEDGKLPRLSVGWVKSNYDQINVHKEDYGVSAGEVARYTSQSGSSQAMLNSVLADRLLKQDADGSSVFGDVATRSPASMSDDLIEKCDLRAFGRQERRHERREAKHDQVLHDSARLLEGEPPLMAVLDASADGKVDGRVSERDMRKFLVNYDVNEQTANRGNYPYTEENKQFVNELLDGKYPDITGSNYTGFSAEALARRAGLDHFIVHNAEDYQTLGQMFRDKLNPVVAETESEEEPVHKENETDNEAPELPKTARDDKADSLPERPAKGDVPEKTFETIEDMCTFQKGEGHWHIAKRLLNAGFASEDRASNKDIWQLTQAMMKVTGHTLDEYGRPNPMVHAGDVIDFSGCMTELTEQFPRLAESLDKFNKES